MRRRDYPAQEPLPPFAQAYDDAVWAKAAAVPAEDIAYGDEAWQRAALVRPARPTGDLVVFLHGGGWTCGFKEWNLFMAPALTSAGLTFASVGYRLAPQATFPVNLRDCEAGIERLLAELRPRRLFVGGHSAGGHLASLLALQPQWRDRVAGCLPISGVYMFGEGSGLAQRPRFLGPEATDEAASPLRQIGDRPPPFLLAWGERDFPHLVAQAADMAAALAAAGGDVETLVLAEKTHLDAHLATEDAAGPWVTKVKAWIGRSGLPGQR